VRVVDETLQYPGDASDIADLSRRELRKAATRTLARAMIVATVVLAAYFALPLSSDTTERAGVFLGVSMIALVVIGWWHLHSVMNSPVPRIRSIAALITTLPLFLVVFATAYFMLSRSDVANFSEGLTRLDALYFALTVFTTVGFGDITPATQLARATTMLQMAANLVLVGLLVRALVSAARVGVARRDRRGPPADG
jgi:preprotein translocase subunit YajC